MNLNELLLDRIERYPDRPAMATPDGQVLTYARFGTAIAALHSRLVREGVTPGQRAIVLTDNPTVRSLLSFALLRHGVELAHVPTARRLTEAGQPVDIVIRFADQPDDPDAPSLIFAQDWLDTPIRTDLPVATQGSFVFSTSGSTGLPKMVRMDMNRPVADARRDPNFKEGRTGAQVIGLPETTYGAMVINLLSIWQGMAVIWLRADPQAVLSQAVQLDAREFWLPPLALHDLVGAAESLTNPPRPDTIYLFGGIANPELLGRAARMFGSRFLVAYGSTECGWISAGLADPATYVGGWCGRLLPGNEVRLADQDAESGAGRVEVRVPPDKRVEGYLGGAAAYDKEGWFDTGDIASLLPGDELVLEGRADNLINLGGTKLAAELIEMIASTAPGVLGVAAVAIQFAGTGQTGLGLAVVGGDEFDADALKLLLAVKLRIRAPIDIRTLSDLPRLPSGKLDRQAVKALFA